MTYTPRPKDCFLSDLEMIGERSGRKTWRSACGKRLYQWDEFHGEVEVYNRRGKHLAVLDCRGITIKDAVEGRSIDV